MSPANFQPVPHVPTVQEIEQASQVIRDAVHVTPMLHSRTFGTMTGANVYLKSENLQRTGSFKVRGAIYKIAQLSEEERRRGVIATSMGNHAQAVAVAAQSFAVPATIVMPEQAPLVKVMATQGYGARVVLHGATFEEASAHARDLQRTSGATFVHAFDDPCNGYLVHPFVKKDSLSFHRPPLFCGQVGLSHRNCKERVLLYQRNPTCLGSRPWGQACKSGRRGLQRPFQS